MLSFPAALNLVSNTQLFFDRIWSATCLFSAYRMMTVVTAAWWTSGAPSWKRDSFVLCQGRTESKPTSTNSVSNFSFVSTTSVMWVSHSPRKTAQYRSNMKVSLRLCERYNSLKKFCQNVWQYLMFHSVLFFDTRYTFVRRMSHGWISNICRLT